MVRACKEINAPLSGLLPVTRNTLTDPALNREWAGMLNPGFSSVVQEVLLNGAHAAENITLKNFQDIMLQNIQPALDRIFLGEVSAQEALTALQSRVQSLLKGAYQ
jgi:multiple sugar transport system substrate-binding protein